MNFIDKWALNSIDLWHNKFNYPPLSRFVIDICGFPLMPLIWIKLNETRLCKSVSSNDKRRK